MFMRKFKVLEGMSLVAIGVALAQAGCGAEVGEIGAPEAQPAGDAIDTVRSAVIVGATSRSDLVKTIELNPGSWGSWSAYRYCPTGSFAVGYRMRVETTGHDDDTTLNAVQLECMDAPGNLSTALAHDGLYGNWYEPAFCDGAFITGGAVRFTPSRGSNDDTAANDAKLRCSNGADVVAPGGIATGNWLTSQTCGAGTSVCGISVRFEANQQSGDDSALNAVRFACCTNPRATSTLRVSEHTMDGIRARTFSPDPGAHRAPLIMVEGLDSDGSFTVDTLPGALPAGFIPVLTSMGYSVTIVDLTKNFESIQANAKRVGALAEQLWAESAKIRPLKMIGASMGGLIVTTAAAMKDGWATLGETNPNWTFQIDHVTTMDAPHAGVYIPEAIYHLLSRSHAHSDTARTLWQAVTSTASMQMQMIPFNLAYENAHKAWQDYYRRVLAVMGKSDIRFVGVVAGSWSGTQQNTGWTSGALNVSAHFRNTLLDLDAELYTQPAPGAKVARVNVDPWGPIGNDDKTYTAYPGNWPIIENTAGGYTDHFQQVAKSLGTSAKYPRQSFVPAWSAAGLSFDLYMALPAAQRDNLSTLENARGPLAGSALTPLDRIFAASGANTQHPNIPATVLPAFLEELQAAIALPGYKPLWTGWLNRDDPSGTGDGENFSLFTNIPCKAPLTAECRRRMDGVDWSRTGEVMTCSAAGSICLNAQQPDGRCDDYEVRFACPNATSVGPWLNRDDPSGNGDGEHLSLLVQAGLTCAQPIGIECQTTAGIDVSRTGEKVLCQANRGLICLNADQSDQFCEDYQERFACPTGGAWTGWMSRDIPAGNGDGEHLSLLQASGQVCLRPLAAECRRISDGMDWSQVGQKMLCNPTQGGICLNANNASGCDDYEVRFFCPQTTWPTLPSIQ